MKPKRFAPLALTALLIGGGLALAAPNDWAEGTPGQSNGASRDYYNRAALLEWRNPLGDWRDARDAAQGNEPYARTTVTAEQMDKPVEWDVTALAQEWLAGKHPNQGMLLRLVAGQGARSFASRERAEAGQRPQLVLTGDKGSLTLAPQADTYLDRSTYRSLGNQDQLRVSDANHALIRFDLRGVDQVGKISQAKLRLHCLAQSGGGEAAVGVFRCAQGHDAADEKPVLGLAAKYPADGGIRADPQVLFATGFESEQWAAEWTQAAPLKALAAVDADADRKFEPLDGKALRSQIAKGATTALNLTWKFKDKAGAEPEAIYFRYYLRLGNDWKQTVQGGKMPGLSGTYGVAGWGGRRADGSNGWSTRGSFLLSIPDDNPLAGLHPIGTYCYHANQAGTYGDIWAWSRGYRGYLANNRWYCVEQFVQLNTPKEKDGVLRAWIDGRLAFEKTDICFRHVDRLKIEQVWMNVYHGGTIPSPVDQHVFIDNVVIARQYIGPAEFKKP